jgi:hypothetical protein
MKRRNLSGVYIFEKFEDEESREPTCFEDCTEATQDRWLESLEKDALKSMCKHLGNKLRHLGDEFDIVAEEEDNDDY